MKMSDGRVLNYLSDGQLREHFFLGLGTIMLEKVENNSKSHLCTNNGLMNTKMVNCLNPKTYIVWSFQSVDIISNSDIDYFNFSMTVCSKI